MGVTGLWRLVEPTGKPVPVETLENKVLAVDISIWLHQVVKGYQDARGAPLPNAHLMGLFQRLCKLLYFRIKPVFVFDGGFPELKKETIAKRQDNKSKYQSESERLKRELALLLSKKTAISSLLGKELSPKKAPRPDPNPAHQDDLFKLPALPEKENDTESDSDEDTSSGSIVDLHSVDLESDNFKKLEVKEKYELLVELKETRKMNSWGKLHELPKKSDNFSDFQLQRLLKRRKLQECLQDTEKQMSSDGMSLNDLEVLLNEEGIDTKLDTLPTRRIASSDSTRFILINNVKQALAEAKKRKLAAIAEKNTASTSQVNEKSEPVEFVKPKTPEHKINELDEDLEKAIQMSLECADEPNTSTASDVNKSNISEVKTDESWSTFMTDTDSEQSECGSDSEDKDGYEQPDMSSAKAYIMQYSDFTHGAIEDIVKTTKGNRKKQKHLKVDKILEELNKEKSIITDEVELSSDDNSDIEEVHASPQDVPSASQASVVCLGEIDNEIISLDTSFDDNIECSEATQENISQNLNKIPESEQKNGTSDSNESDFEEVTDDITSKINPTIELTLKLPTTAPEDDIFADIFEDYKTVSTLKSKPNSESTVKLKVEEDYFDHIPVENNDSDLDMSSNSKEDIEHCNIFFENDENSQVADKKRKEKEEKRVEVNEESERVNNLVKDPTKSSDNRITVVNASLLERDSSVHSEIKTANKNPSTTIHKTAGNIQNKPKEKMSTEKLNEMVENIQNEENNLIQEKGRLDRIGRNITEQMTKDAQELLQIFGIPYIVAPMEAEAQCAFLESVNLTDGTITDDSDIWLFGGRTVYKNFFNQKKHVLQFLAERIEKSFNLTREQLILLAMLVGSDYTTGLQGVGPVTALEILAAFPHCKRLSEESKQARYNSIVTGLQEFKRWVRAGKRTDDNSLKKKLKNVQITDDFPSVRVVQAYLEPNVEKNEDNFTWGELDITVLRDYTKSKFGWSQNKLDEIMKPVISRLQNRHAQKSLQDYFKRKIEFHSLEDQVSKRVKAAIQKMGPEAATHAELLLEAEKPTKKRKYNKKKTIEENNEAGPSTAAENETTSPKKRISNTPNLPSQFNTKVPKQKVDRPKLNPNLPRELSTVVAKVQKLKEQTSLKPKPINVHKKEIIPQREKDKLGILENKLKAIEVFRKTKIDTKSKAKKRKPNLPKDEADLSESDSD